MKVAILLGSLNRGGTETLILDTFNNLEDNKKQFICIYRADGLMSDAYRNTGVPMFRIYPRYKFDLKYVIALHRFFARNRVDIAHAQQPLDAFFAWLATRGLKTKVFFTMHGFDFRFGKIIRMLTSFVFKLTDLNLFVSNSQREYFIEKYNFSKDRSRVVYNGVSFVKMENFSHHSLRKEFNIPAGHLLFGSVGNFNQVRDQMTLCRFIKLFKSQNIDFTFIFAGSQSKSAPWYWDDCQKYIQENGLESNVIFAGSREDIPNILSQLDAFLYSSNHDTFGIATIEAISMGIPVFLNDWSVFFEITDQGKYGNLYKSKDETDLLVHILDFIKNQKEYKLKSRQNAHWVKERYSIQNHLHNLFKIYHLAVNES